MTGRRRNDHLRPASGPEAGRFSLQQFKPEKGKHERERSPEIQATCAVEIIYGMCGSAWTQGGVKMIHAPLKYAVSA